MRFEAASAESAQTKKGSASAESVMTQMKLKMELLEKRLASVESCESREKKRERRISDETSEIFSIRRIENTLFSRVHATL